MAATVTGAADAMTTPSKPGARPAPESPAQPWDARLVDAAAGLAAAAMLAVVLVQVVGRLRGAPVAWSEELTRALFIWMMFLGLAGSMRAADAARVSVLVELVPAPRQVALWIYMAGCLLFFALMGWTGWAMVRQQWAMNETVATLGLPSWIIGVIMPLSAVLAAWGTLASLRDHRDAIALQPAVAGEGQP